MPAVRDGLLLREYGVFNPAKSRIKVFDFDTKAARCPTPAPSATRPGACTPARSRRSRIDAATGAKVVIEATCVGCKVCTIACPFGTINYMADIGKVQKCDLCGGDPACAKACPTGAITYIDADWTGLDRMRAWAGNAPTSRRAVRRNDHVLEQKTPARQSDRRHLQARTAQHGSGRATTSARAAWPPSIWSRRSIPRSIRCRPPTS